MRQTAKKNKAVQVKVVRLEAVRKGQEKGNEGEILQEKEVVKKIQYIFSRKHSLKSSIACIFGENSEIMNLQHSKAYENRKKSIVFLHIHLNN